MRPSKPPLMRASSDEMMTLDALWMSPEVENHAPAPGPAAEEDARSYEALSATRTKCALGFGGGFWGRYCPRLWEGSFFYWMQFFASLSGVYMPCSRRTHEERRDADDPQRLLCALEGSRHAGTRAEAQVGAATEKRTRSLRREDLEVVERRPLAGLHEPLGQCVVPPSGA